LNINEGSAAWERRGLWEGEEENVSLPSLLPPIDLMDFRSLTRPQPSLGLVGDSKTTRDESDPNPPFTLSKRERITSDNIILG